MPIVSVVTPVHNGERYLAECIESVLAQSFRDFEYIIVDNSSTDGTRDIAQRYATDPRVRIHSASTFVPAIANYNRGAKLVSADARYLHYVAADDFLFPECLKEMVELGEAHPTVRLVSSFKVHGKRTICDGPAFPQSVMGGKEVCRFFFRGRRDLLGGPTNHLLRLPLEKTRDGVFDEQFIHSDTELFIRLLKDGADYGFVHKVLTMSREHEATLSARVADVLGTRSVEMLAMLVRHGPAFLSDSEFRALLVSYRRTYARWLFRVLVKPWDRRGWRYQVSRREEFNLPVGWLDLVDGGLREMASSLIEPGVTLRRIRNDYRRVAAGRS
jgi:glycosyltransferase involved in cell wall biosynthesis